MADSRIKNPGMGRGYGGGRKPIYADNPTGLLRCPHCLIEGHGGAEFRQNARQGHPCKPCANVYHRAWIERSPRGNEWQAERRRINRELVDDYKMARGCTDCGYRVASVALDFHHIDPATKFANVCNLVRRAYPIETIAAEIEKCIVICSNCHRIRSHAERRTDA